MGNGRLWRASDAATGDARGWKVYEKDAKQFVAARDAAWTAHEVPRSWIARARLLSLAAREFAMGDHNPRKLIFWLMRWGWRGPAALVLVVLGVWLIPFGNID